MQTMGNKAKKTHCSQKELQCKEWVIKQRRLIVHKVLQCNNGRLIVHTRSYNANNG
ncbi:hypothetical protein KSS87_016825 [Heliosperma pusillum]|nr:hypothetical protein KSS87_016825 [Heliosperma pusillum]